MSLIEFTSLFVVASLIKHSEVNNVRAIWWWQIVVQTEISVKIKEHFTVGAVSYFMQHILCRKFCYFLHCFGFIASEKEVLNCRQLVTQWLVTQWLLTWWLLTGWLTSSILWGLTTSWFIILSIQVWIFELSTRQHWQHLLKITVFYHRNLIPVIRAVDPTSCLT